MRKFSIYLFLGIVSIVFAGPAFGVVPSSSADDPLVTLEVTNKPFKDVADDLSRQSGFKIIFDEKWNSIPVSGKYSAVTLEEFFRRVFRKQNTSLLFDNQQKLVVVRFFGDKSFKELLSSSLADSAGSADQVTEEIRELHAQQRQELEDYLNDPESVDPLSGMKLVEIRAMHDQQRSELEQSLSDPNTVDPVSGSSLGDIEQLHKEQGAEIEQFRNNPENVEPETGMTIAQIKALHDAQRAELQRMLNDPNTVDPISGKTLAEIWEQTGKTNN